jgi:N-methylhydantoinase A/oxoprolinase/acetone carboxylase beta subunit
LLSAVGLVSAQPTFLASRTIKLDLRDMQPGRLGAPVAELRHEIAVALRTVDPQASPEYVVSAECAYSGQSATLPVTLSDPESADGVSIGSDFAAAYQATYGHRHLDVAVQVVTVIVSGRLSLTSPELPRDDREWSGLEGSRRAWSHGTGRFEDFAVRWRANLRTGQHIDGPAIICETESTTIIDVDGQAYIDDLGNLSVSVGSRGGR